MRDLDISSEPLDDRVGGVGDPDAAEISVLAPVDVAGRAHKIAERLAVMPGVKDYKTHTLENAVAYAAGDLFGNFVMSHMSPPDKHVGVVKNVLGQSAFGILQGGGAHLYILAGEKTRDRLVDAFGVDRPDALLRALVFKFIPNCYSDHL